MVRLLWLLLLLPGLAQALPLDRIKTAGVLRIGTPGEYLPYAIRAEDGSFSGAEVDLARDFAKALGVRAEFVPTSWRTLAEDFTAGRFDLVVGGVSVTPEREQLGAFSVALSQDGKRPLVRCADRDRYPGLEAIDRPDIRVIANPGGTNEGFARAHFTAAALTISPDNASVPARLIEGSADVFVTDGVEVDLLARRFPGLLCAAAVPAPFTHVTKAWWLAGDAALARDADVFLAAALADGTWQAALDRHLH